MAHSVRHFFCPQHEGYWVSRLLSDGVFCADSVAGALPVPVDTTTGYPALLDIAFFSCASSTALSSAKA